MASPFSLTPVVGLRGRKLAIEAGDGSLCSTAAAANEGESIWVGVRMRPLNAQEKDSRQHSSWTAADDKTLKFRDTPEKAHAHLPTAYHYDRVFSEQYNTQAVYEAAGRERVLSALQGLNSTLFVYGQTGSGKTYTMRSIVAAASEDIFKHIKANPGREFLIRLSAIEIYNERVRDLLQDGTEMQDLQLREHADKGTVAEGLSDEGIRSAAHLASLLQAVEARRTVRDTRLNAESSRSHQIVRIYVESRPASAEEDPAAEIAELDTLDTKSDGDEPEDLRPVKISTLNFVDLAGSERSALAAKADGMEKIRHAEGSSINKSLLTLGKVIRDLADAKAHIPFRDSKLTRMLQPSLGGNSRTAIICTISPASGAIDNTRTALHFANAAKNVRVQPKVNEVLNERALLRRMQAEIASLRRQLATRDFAVEAAELSAALREKEQHIKLTEGQKAEAEKRLRNLERLILRGDGNGTVKRRKSWSALPSPKSDLVAGGTASQMSARQAAAMRMSWNHGDASASLDSPNSTRKHLFQMQAMRGNNRGDKLLLDCFINPAIRHACPPADHAQPSAASLSAGSSAAAAIPSSPANDLKRIEQLQGPTGVDAERALAALQAEVRCIKHSSGPSGEDADATITRLQAELARVQEDRVMEVAAREETISALRAELARLQDAQSAQRAADEALASLQSKIDALQMSREGSLRGSLTDQAGSSALPAGWSPGAAATQQEGPAVKAGDQPGTPAHRRPSSPDARIQRVAPGDDSPCDAFARSPSSSPLMDSPVRSLDAQDDKENSLEPLSQSRIHLTADTRANGGTPLTMAGLMSRMAGLVSSSPQADGALQPKDASMGSSRPFQSMDRASSGRKASGRRRREGGAGGEAAPNQMPDAAAQMYKSEVRRMQAAFKEAVQRDVAGLKEALEQYREQVQRLECQKQLLLNQVLRLEYKVEESQQTHASLQQQLAGAQAEATSARAAANAAASAAAAERSARMPDSPGFSSSPGIPAHPRVPPLKLQGEIPAHMLDTRDSWIAAPSVETLMPKIVAMWEELHVPLVHRSRFYLAFRGRETFYYEAEHRRLCYLRALIIGTAEEDDSSPAEQRQTQKKLEKARRKLEWERKFLAQQLKWDCTPEEREEMFLQWNVHRDSKERKLQLVRRLWSPPVIQDTEGMRKSSELVLRLNGTEATDGMFDLVFGRSQGDGWVKSMLATGGSMLGPVLSKVVVGGQAALRGSSPSKPGKVGERRRSFLGSLGLTPRRQSSRTAAAWS